MSKSSVLWLRETGVSCHTCVLDGSQQQPGGDAGGDLVVVVHLQSSSSSSSSLCSSAPSSRRPQGGRRSAWTPGWGPAPCWGRACSSQSSRTSGLLSTGKMLLWISIKQGNSFGEKESFIAFIKAQNVQNWMHKWVFSYKAVSVLTN